MNNEIYGKAYFENYNLGIETVNYSASIHFRDFFKIIAQRIVDDFAPKTVLDVGFAQRRDVGAVGAMLYYPDNTVQHAGVCLGLGGPVGHYHHRVPRGHTGYVGRLLYAQNVSAVTGACLMTRKEVFEAAGGFDEELAVAFNDVDLCLKIRASGYLIVWTPYAELYHYESLTRGHDNTPEKTARCEREVVLWQARWAKELEAGDPYYNPNLTLDRADFSLRQKD